MKTLQVLLGCFSLLLLLESAQANPFLRDAFHNFMANSTAFFDNLRPSSSGPQRGGLIRFLQQILSRNEVHTGPPGDVIMTSQKDKRKEAIEASASFDGEKNPLSGVAKLFEMDFPQISELSYDSSSGFKGMAGITALGMLALGALLASPAPNILRRSDDTQEQSFLDVLSNLWSNDEDEKHKRIQYPYKPLPAPHKGKVYHVYKNDPPPFGGQGRERDEYYSDTFEPSPTRSKFNPYDNRRYDSNDQDDYYYEYEGQPLDKPLKLSESAKIRSVYPKKKKESLWSFAKDKMPQYDPNGLVKRSDEPHVYLTVEE